MYKARKKEIKIVNLFFAVGLLILNISAQKINPEIILQTGHSNYVQSTAFSINGKLIATGGLDGMIKIWETESGLEVRSIKATNYGIYSLSFSPDSLIIASGSSTGDITLWDVTNGNLVKSFSNSPIEINSIKFSSDGKLLAAGGYEKITLWEVEGGQEFKIIEGPKFKKFTTVDFSLNDNLLAARNEDGTASIWDVYNGQLLKIFKEQKYISTVAFSPDGKVLAGSVDLNLKFWNVETGQEIKTIKLSDWVVTSLAFSADGVTLAGGSNGNLILWDWREGNEIKKFKGNEFSSVAFYPNGKILAGSIDSKTVNVWDVSSGQITWSLRSRTSEVELFAVSPDNKLIAWADNRETIKLVDLQSGQLLKTITGHKKDITSIIFSPDSNFLATGSLDKTIKIWDVKSGLEIKTFNGHSNPVTALSFSSNGEVLASGSLDKTVKIWDTATGLELKTIKIQELNQKGAYIKTLEFSSDSKTLASVTGGVYIEKNGENDNKIIVWNVETGNKLRTFNGDSTSVAFSTNGKTIASADTAGKVELWDLTNGSLLKTLKREISISREVFSPDASTIALAGADNKIRLWDVEKEQVIKILEGHSKSIKSLAFSSDGQKLVTGSSDDTIKIWNTLSGQLITTLKGHVDEISAVTISADGATLASESRRGTINIWNVETGQIINTIEDPYLHSSIKASLVFSPDGKVLASSRGKDTNKDLTDDVFSINLWSVADGKLIKTFAGNDSHVVALAFSTNGKILASSGAFDKTVKLWDVETGQTLKILKSDASGILQAIAFSPDGEMIAHSDIIYSDTKIWGVKNGQLLRTFSGKGAAIAFSVDSKKLNIAYENLKQFDLNSGQLIKQNELRRITIGSVKFINNDTQIVGLGKNGETILWNASDGQELASDNLSDSLNLRTKNEQLLNINNKTFRIRFEGSSIELFDISKTKLASIISVNETDWLVSTPEGLFDGSPRAWKQLIWRFDNNTFNYAPVEAFFKEFYRPGLLQGIFAGNKIEPPLQDLSKIDIRQPLVKIVEIDGKPVESSALSPGKVSADKNSIKVKLEINDNASVARPGIAKKSSDANDLRLFRNGSLVRLWKKADADGSQTASVFDLTEKDGCAQIKATKDTPRKALCETEVQIAAGENSFTAYAFNHENVKSADAPIVAVTGTMPKREGTLYVLAIGVNDYLADGHDLRYAVPDVEKISAAIKTQQDKLRQDAKTKQYADTKIIKLTDRQATKRNVMLALRRFSGRAGGEELPADVAGELAKAVKTEPEDGLLIYFAGHGTARCETKNGRTNCDRFYLIPHEGFPAKAVSDNERRRLLYEQSISDEELERELEPIDAGRMLMVIDACQSGAIEGEEKRRGPMNSRGLAQLAYEKGMSILTAAQSDTAALEVTRIGGREVGHGLLTWALLEAMRDQEANKNPADEYLSEREWFEYAGSQVPKYQFEMMRQRSEENKNVKTGEQPRSEIYYVNGDDPNLNPEKRRVQTPRLFYRREIDLNPLIVAKP